MLVTVTERSIAVPVHSDVFNFEQERRNVSLRLE